MQSDTAHSQGEVSDGEDKIQVKRQITKSALSFPYINLEDVVELARAMQEAGGVPLLRDQVANAMNTTADHGTFNLKISAARMFDIVEFLDNRFQLTDTGNGIISTDEAIQRTARRDAFLSVELYRKAVEHFRGKALPSNRNGLEAALVSFGVSEKQKDKARQAFEKSAIYAGFMDSSKVRLVEPIIAPSVKTERYGENLRQILNTPIGETPKPRPEGEMSPTDPLQEPLILGLLKRLPPVGDDWPLKDRVKWLRTLIGNFTACYSDPKNSSDRYEIDVQLKLDEWPDDAA